MQENRSRNVIAAACGLAIGFAVLWPNAAAAQDDSKYNSISTPAQRTACRPDVFRFCAGEIPNVARITACMRRNKANLSDACKAVFDQ